MIEIRETAIVTGVSCAQLAAQRGALKRRSCLTLHRRSRYTHSYPSIFQKQPIVLICKFVSLIPIEPALAFVFHCFFMPTTQDDEKFATRTIMVRSDRLADPRYHLFSICAHNCSIQPWSLHYYIRYTSHHALCSLVLIHNSRLWRSMSAVHRYSASFNRDETLPLNR